MLQQLSIIEITSAQNLFFIVQLIFYLVAKL